MKYKDILSLFSNTSELEVVNENTFIESIRHKPTGWYFYTTTANFIIGFNNKNGGDVEAPTLSYLIQDIFTKPAKKIQKAVYEAKIAE